VQLHASSYARAVRRLTLVTVLSCLLVAGCGGSGVSVSKTVVKDVPKSKLSPLPPTQGTAEEKVANTLRTYVNGIAVNEPEAACDQLTEGGLKEVEALGRTPGNQARPDCASVLLNAGVRLPPAEKKVHQLAVDVRISGTHATARYKSPLDRGKEKEASLVRNGGRWLITKLPKLASR
jgi:hypothetical protein